MKPGPSVNEQKKIDSIFRAAEWGDISKLREYLDSSGDITVVNNEWDSLLHVAVGNGKLNFCKMLLENNMDVNVRAAFRATPLMMAAQLGNVNILRLLLDYGADIEAKNEDQETAIMYAAFGNKEACIKELKAFGADVGNVSKHEIGLDDYTKVGEEYREEKAPAPKSEVLSSVLIGIVLIVIGFVIMSNVEKPISYIGMAAALFGFLLVLSPLKKE